jgi:phosphoglycolate phosphatase
MVNQKRSIHPKAVLFDLDGTLLDTLEDLGNAMNRVLTRRGFPTRSLDAYRYFIGEGTVLLVTRALPPSERNDSTIRKCLEAFLEEYDRTWNVRTRAYDGVEDVLGVLTDRGLRMAVLSNKPDDFTKRCVAQLLPNWRFDLVLGQRDGVPPKPDPMGALEVARGLSLSPAAFLYIGDSAIDMKTAVAAGMFPVGVLWGFRPLEELQEGGAQALIQYPMEILELLG